MISYIDCQTSAGDRHRRSPASLSPDARAWRRGIAPRTGPLDPLSGHKALLLADVENLSFGAADLGFSLCYQRLSTVLTICCPGAELHAFFSRDKEDKRFEAALSRIGWHCHARDIETVPTAYGSKRLANSDHVLAFGAGLFATRDCFEVIILATGDGALGCDLAAAIRRHRGKDISLFTLSVAGSTSRRLNSTRNPDLAENRLHRMPAHVEPAVEGGERDQVFPRDHRHLQLSARR
jgi:hypothetical protein